MSAQRRGFRILNEIPVFRRKFKFRLKQAMVPKLLWKRTAILRKAPSWIAETSRLRKRPKPYQKRRQPWCWSRTST